MDRSKHAREGYPYFKHASRRASSTFQPYKLQAFKSFRLLYHPSARALGSRGSDEKRYICRK